jgi:hypothetical protein
MNPPMDQPRSLRPQTPERRRHPLRPVSDPRTAHPSMNGWHFGTVPRTGGARVDNSIVHQRVSGEALEGGMGIG